MRSPLPTPTSAFAWKSRTRLFGTGLDRSIAVPAAAGLLTAVLYLAATVRLSLPRYFPGPGISIGFPQMLDGAWDRIALQYAGFVVAAFALYAVALAAVWRAPRSAPPLLLWGVPVLAVLILAWMYPPTAMDVFHYDASARVFWVHGDNPFTVPPAAYPYAIGISWADRPSVYGPVWTWLAGLPVLLTGEHYLAGVVAFKLMAGGFLLGSAWLIHRLVARTRPGWEALAVVAFAWNPFLLLRVAGHGHNDIVMMFFVLLALERAERRRWTPALWAMAMSVLVKYVTALLVPMLLWYAWQQIGGTVRARLRALAPGLGAMALTAFVAYLPFWDGRATFKTISDQFGGDGFMITSVPLLIDLRLERVISPDTAASTARDLTRAAYLACYLPLLWQSRRDIHRLIACSATALFLYVVIASGWFRPWYMIWPLAVAALMPNSWFTPLAFVIALSGVFPDLVEQDRGHWAWLADYWRAQVAPVATAFALPALAWCGGLLYFRTWHFNALVPATSPGLPAPSEISPGVPSSTSSLLSAEAQPARAEQRQPLRALTVLLLGAKPQPGASAVAVEESALERNAGLVVLAFALAAGVALRLWLALGEDGIYWPDEIYQSLEPAHRLVFGHGLQAWEFVAGARSWAFPGMLAALLKLCALTGQGDPRHYLLVIRLALIAAGAGTVYGCYRLALAYRSSRLAAACGAALFALLAPAVYFAPRAMSETVSALPVVLGFALALHPAAGRPTRVVGASLLGLAVLLRLQNAVFCAGLPLIFAGRRQWRQAGEAVAVALVWAFLFGLLDRITWGEWFQSARVYLRFNLIEGQAAEWGTEPPAYYLRVLISSAGFVPVLFLVTLMLLAADRAPGLLAVALAFAALHALSPHKDLRFIFPLLPLACALAGIGLDSLLRLAGVDARAAQRLRLGAAAFVVLLASLSAAELPGLTFGDLGHYEQDPPGLNAFYKPAASAYDDGGDVNRLLIAASRRDDVCGLKVESISLTWTGGYSYFHRAAPLYPAWGPGPESGHYNYVITTAAALNGAAEIAAREGDQVLARVSQAPCVPDPDYHGQARARPGRYEDEGPVEAWMGSASGLSSPG